MPESILIPIDGSKGARRGATHALELASANAADVHLLFVVEDRIHGGTPALSTEELYLETVERNAERRLAAVSAQARERGVEATVVCRRGNPCDIIPSYAREHGIDTIVMGRHGAVSGRRNHHRACIDVVSNTSDVPVVTV
ncbi:universal stress protein [Halogeometricum luteum]|uniref:Universal stress protein n=1 Tax=Halogeometricum luteum TaxID=2950537 RepID=A0ABU2G395_9EURY|nr:universal stress protein [Halogeometricum sp. S3BR5-2]MDS0295248.1 universal stress protein [Halogeometricum sp. S3BR5-2]